MTKTHSIEITINRKTGERTVKGTPIEDIKMVFPEAFISIMAEICLKHFQKEEDNKIKKE
jgi:hypothetical protein